MTLSNKNPVPKSWLAIEPTNESYSVVRCYPDSVRVEPVRDKFRTMEAAAAFISKQTTAFGHNAEVD